MWAPRFFRDDDQCAASAVVHHAPPESVIEITGPINHSAAVRGVINGASRETLAPQEPACRAGRKMLAGIDLPVVETVPRSFGQLKNVLDVWLGAPYLAGASKFCRANLARVRARGCSSEAAPARHLRALHTPSHLRASLSGGWRGALSSTFAPSNLSPGDPVMFTAPHPGAL
ncbi:hypothetical protein MRX96_021459 [Rhipicephalus microplus]|uniref:Uncharacterized protein n=1 Tax=Rhipicephalus microplus TaxID=6941 RepID=A0A9J6CTH3_RHIMP|nr:hypothetical protein HPB51_029751 [Rhipicephalus microplus]